MRRIGWGLIACVIALALSSSALGDDAMKKRGTDETVGAAEVGSGVEKALHNANETGLNGLRLADATLSIETGATQEVNGTINLIVFTISHKSTKGATQTTTLHFGEVAQKSADMKAPEIEDLATPLAKMIATAAELASAVKTLPLTDAKVKIEFVAQRESSGAVTFKILAADGSAGINFKKVSKNSLEVSFARPKPTE
jgi:hypothetical protein